MTSQYGENLPEWVAENIEKNWSDAPVWSSRSWSKFRDQVDDEPDWIVPASSRRLAVGLASGRSWLGVPIPEPVPVL